MITIGIDPQPTLTAMCLHYNNTYWVVGKQLCTSKRRKIQQVSKWMNHEPGQIIEHLDELFEPFNYLLDDETIDICVGIEMQIKKKYMYTLEAFIKGYLTTRYRNIVSCHSIRAPDWQGKMVPEIITRKDYAPDGWSLLNNLPYINVDLDASVKNRTIDMVDAFYICQFTMNFKN